MIFWRRYKIIIQKFDEYKFGLEITFDLILEVLDNAVAAQNTPELIVQTDLDF